MKFQVKALIAALAMTVSGVASAASASTGNGSLWLTVLDATNKVYSTFDTGLFYSDLNEIGVDVADSGFDTANKTFSINLGSTFTSFVNAAGSNPITYALFAADTLRSGASTGKYGLITTYATDPSSYTPAFSLISAASGKFEQDLTNSNIATGFYVDSNLAGAGPTVTGLLGSNLGLFQAVSGSTANNAGTNFIYTQSTVNLNSSGLLTISSVSAVPEPENFALIALGMGVVAAAARRRKSTK